jgi:hypothetical protein
MLLATARGIKARNERKTAAGLESHDEKFQAGERKKSEPLIRLKDGFGQISHRKLLLFVKCIIPATSVTSLIIND